MKKTLFLLMMALFMPLISNAVGDVDLIDDGEDVYVTYNGLRFHRYQVRGGYSEWSQQGYLNVSFKLALPESGQYSGDLVIPQTIPYHYETEVHDIFNFAGNHHIESEIGRVVGAEFSFEGNETITSVTYPEYFVVSSFKGCTNLRKIVLPTTPTTWLSTDYKMPIQMFMGCKNLEEVSHIAHFGYLRESTFEGCEKLQKIDLTETYEDTSGNSKVASINSIEQSAFKDCKSLESLDLSNVTSIGSYAFQGCLSLEEVTFGKNLFINSGAEGIFSECTSLKTVSGFENMKNQQYSSSTSRTMPAYTFRNCNSLENISLPSTDDLRIEASAFEGCESLKQIGGDFSVSSASQIKEAAFKGCKSLETLPINWKGGGSFKREVFSGCHNLSFGDTLKAYSCGNSSFRE